MHCDIRSSSSQDRHSDPEGSFSARTFLELWEETAGNPQARASLYRRSKAWRWGETFLIRGALTHRRTTQTPTQPSILLENVLHCWFFSILPGLGHSRGSLCCILRPSRPLLFPTVLGWCRASLRLGGAEGHISGGNVLLPAPQNHSGPERFAQMGEQ